MSITSPLEALLNKFCRPLNAPDYPGGTEKTNAGNSLDFLVKTVPQFTELIRGNDVLDFGCGLGWQAIALAQQGIAKSVVGLDIRLTELARKNAEQHHVQERVQFTNSLQPGQLFDVAYSCSSFEHFGDPEGILRQMLAVTKPGGHVIVSFAEPWYSPHGSHMDGITKLPWVNILFPERVVLAVRSRYRTDGATRYEEYEGGLNRMSLRKFDGIMRRSGATIVYQRYVGVKGLPLVTNVPLVRELLTSAAACVLKKP